VHYKLLVCFLVLILVFVTVFYFFYTGLFLAFDFRLIESFARDILHVSAGLVLCVFVCGLAYTGCLQLLEILEISWNLN